MNKNAPEWRIEARDPNALEQTTADAIEKDVNHN